MHESTTTTSDSSSEASSGDDAPARPLRPLTFAEMTAGLIWPTLFRTVVMALQPSRVVLAFGLVVLLAVIANVVDGVLGLAGAEPIAFPLLDGVEAGLVEFSQQLFAMKPAAALLALYEGVFVGPLGSLGHRWLSTLFFMALALPAWAILGGALSRMVATDIAGHLAMSSGDGLRFALSRVSSLVGALVVPLVLLAAFAGALALAGWVALSLPGLRVVGALLYGGLLFIGLVLTFLYVGFVVGQALLIPAVATEGSDAIDAMQRAYAYVWGRPARALGYAGFCLLQGAIVCALVKWFVDGGIGLTSDMAQSWLSQGAASALAPAGEGAESTTASRIIFAWNQVAGLLVPTFVISFYFSASTIVYMLLRRLNDEQDLHEIWMPGLDPGTIAPAAPLDSRGE